VLRNQERGHGWAWLVTWRKKGTQKWKEGQKTETNGEHGCQGPAHGRELMMMIYMGRGCGCSGNLLGSQHTRLWIRSPTCADTPPNALGQHVGHWPRLHVQPWASRSVHFSQRKATIYMYTWPNIYELLFGRHIIQGYIVGRTAFCYISFVWLSIAPLASFSNNIVRTNCLIIRFMSTRLSKVPSVLP